MGGCFAGVGFVRFWFADGCLLGFCESLRLLLMWLAVCSSTLLITRLLWFCIIVLKFSVQL